jgi:hypothetical protein
MRPSALALLWACCQTVRADCGWRLNANDCLCINSVDGSAWTDYTNYCCKAMGLKTSGMVSVVVCGVLEFSITEEFGQGPVCNVAQEHRDTFKDCCKEQNKTSLIGHCR